MHTSGYISVWKTNMDRHVSEKRGDVLIEQHPFLWKTHGVLPQHALVTVRHLLPFRLLVDSFSRNLIWLLKRQIVGYAFPDPPQDVPFSISYAKIISI